MAFPQERGRERARRELGNPLEMRADCKRRKNIGRDMMTMRLYGVIESMETLW